MSEIEGKNGFLTQIGQVFKKGHIIDEILEPYKSTLRMVRVTCVVTQIFNIFSVVVGAYFVGMVASGKSLNDLDTYFFALLVLTLGHYLLQQINSIWAHKMSFIALGDLRKALYYKLDELAPAYMMDKRSGDVVRTALSDIRLLELYTSHTVPEYMQLIVITPIVLLIMGFFHWSLMLALAPFLVIAATVPDWFSKRAEKQGKGIRSASGEMSADVVDGVQGIREIVCFGAQKRMLYLINKVQKSYSKAYVEHQSRSGIERGMSDFILSAGILVIVSLGAWLIMNGQMSLDYYPAATVLAAMAFQPIMKLTNIARDLSQVIAAAERVFAIMNAKPSVKDFVTSSPSGAIVPEVRFEDVGFHYGPGLPEVLRGATFSILPGEKVALVGHSGAGKSTCMYLLLRFWDPTSGSIRIGGHDLREFPQDHIRRMIAYVPQDVYLFNISVRENIRIGRFDASDAEVFEAARRAYALDFIEDLPDSWDTVLGERGATLSGGQRQRIAIARAFLKDTPVLVMDEAVSNLDTESEIAVRQAMNEISAGRTTIIIAHRPSTIKSADRVIMLEDGSIIETSTFEELIKKEGVFSCLMALKQKHLKETELPS